MLSIAHWVFGYYFFFLITARSTYVRSASAVLLWECRLSACPSVRPSVLSVCLSVTLVHCDLTARRTGLSYTTTECIVGTSSENLNGNCQSELVWALGKPHFSACNSPYLNWNFFRVSQWIIYQRYRRRDGRTDSRFATAVPRYA